LLSRYSGLATSWTTDESGFDYVQAEESFLFSKVSRRQNGPTEVPVNVSLSLFSWEINRPERGVKNSSLSSYEFKNEWHSTFTQCLHCPNSDNFIFDFLMLCSTGYEKSLERNIITKVTAATGGTR
jgi:hypothetical protein